MQSTDEVWKEVPSLKGNYFASSLGRIRSKWGCIRKLKKNKEGYILLAVSNGKGNSTNVLVARLVCEAFHGQCPEKGMEVDHINKVRDDNRPENLRWVTKAFNLSQRLHRRNMDHQNTFITDDQVRLIRSTPHFPRMDYIFAEKIGCSRESIRDIRLGKQRKYV